MKQILKTTKPEADTFPAFTLHLNREAIAVFCLNAKICCQNYVNHLLNSRFVLVIRTPCILSAHSYFF